MTITRTINGKEFIFDLTHTHRDFQNKIDFGLQKGKRDEICILYHSYGV